MWKNYCHNGIVKVRSTKWPFKYTLNNFAISTLEVLHCSFHHALLVSCIQSLSHVHPLFNPILRRSFDQYQWGMDSTLLYFFAVKVAMIIKLDEINSIVSVAMTIGRNKLLLS